MAPIVKGAQAELEEIETSRAEKLLAVGLVAFLLVGGFWVVDRLGSVPKKPDYQAIATGAGLPAAEQRYRTAQSDFQRAEEAAQSAAAAEEKARSEYEYRREEYRLALERGLAAPELAAAYESARRDYDKARAQTELAQAVRESLAARLAGPQADYEQAQGRVEEAVRRAENRYQLEAFCLRFGYALPLFGLAVWLWLILRRRRARYLILATAFMGFAGIQALALIGQYGWYLLRDIGPIALSVAGSAVCVAGLVGLGRWASSPGRVTRARFRRAECPHCGFPVGAGAVAGAVYCPDCGRKVLEPCPACGGLNMSASSFCRHCGNRLAPAAASSTAASS